jgi:D-Tyr-tRNAtyr deacylase
MAMQHASCLSACALLPSQVAGIDGEVLLVSQFTLYGRLKKPKPDFSKAMGPDKVGCEERGLAAAA